MTNCYITFHTTYHAIRSESVLKNAGFDCRLVPVPRKIGSSCEIALQCKNSELSSIKQMLSQSGIEIDGAQSLNEEEFSLIRLFHKRL